jgi:hypothetical protein
MKLTADLHLVPRLRMSGSIPQLPLYAFMACAEMLPFLPLRVIFSDYNELTVMKEFFILYLHIFIHGVYICPAYIPSWCISSLSSKISGIM